MANGQIVTFYSYKGGVGRTMALANVACLLANWGYSVLIVDWDLEAPGIEYYFTDYLVVEDVQSRDGVIDLIYAASQADITSAPSIDWKDVAITVPIDKETSNLHMISAGKRNDDYFNKVRTLDLRSFYEEKQGGKFFETIRNEWKDSYDFVLIDSRTGITDIGGVCTIQLPDILLLLFAATEQNLLGIVEVGKKVQQARQNMPLDRFGLPLLPLLCRFDSKEEREISRKWLSKSADKLQEFYSYWLPDNTSEREFLELTKIPYIPYYSFGEKLPIMEEGTFDPTGIGFAYEATAAILANQLQSITTLLRNRSRYVNVAKRRILSEKDIEELGEIPGELGKLTTDTELDLLETRYAQYLVRSLGYVDLGGMAAKRGVNLPLENVFVGPDLYHVSPALYNTSSALKRTFSQLEQSSLAIEDFADEKLDRLEPIDLLGHLEQRMNYAEILSDLSEPGYVLLGNPGIGKTTLMKALTLQHVRRVPTPGSNPEAKTGEPGLLPIYVPLNSYVALTEDGNRLPLSKLISEYYRVICGLPDPSEVFDRAFQEGRGLILLDGLDEVPTSDRKWIIQQIEAFIDNWGSLGSRVMVSSRIAGYQMAPLRTDLLHLILADFSSDQVQKYITYWLSAYERTTNEEINDDHIQKRVRKLVPQIRETLARNARLDQLARNPLLLTQILLISHSFGKLPSNRVLLYENYVRMTLENWLNNRYTADEEPSFQLLDYRKTLQIFYSIAYHIQRKKASSLIDRFELKEILIKFFQNDTDGKEQIGSRIPSMATEERADRFIDDLRHGNRLLVESGTDLFGFVHLSFQEYLVSAALANYDSDTRWRQIVPILHDPRWLETILLCTGQLGLVRQKKSQVIELVDSILEIKDSTEVDLHRNLLLTMSIGGEDVGISKLQIRKIQQMAIHALSITNVDSLAERLISGLFQLIVSGQVDPDRTLQIIWESSGSSVRLKTLEIAGDYANHHEILKFIIDRAYDKEFPIRQATIKALAKVKSLKSPVLNTLEKALTDDDPRIRTTAVRVVGQSDLENNTFFISDLLDDDDPQVRQATAEVLVRSGRKALVFPLLRDRDPKVRATIVEELGQVDQEDVSPHIVHALNDNDPQVRRAAIHALVRFGEIESIIPLLGDNDPNVREAAVEVIGQIDQTDVSTILFPALEDDNARVRQAAVRAISKVGDRMDQTALMRMALEDPNVDVRRTVIGELSPDLNRIDGGYDLLLKLENSDIVEEQELFIEAVEAAGQVPRFRPHLISLLRTSSHLSIQICAALVLLKSGMQDQGMLDLGLIGLSFTLANGSSAVKSRLAAVEILRLLGLESYSEIIYDSLRKTMQDDASPEVRDAAYHAMLSLASTKDRQRTEYLSCFISYSHRDEEFARQLFIDLQENGVRCWFAPESLHVGENLRKAVDTAIRTHDSILLIVSKNSVRSLWVKSEINAAFSQEKKRGTAVLFPVRLDDAVFGVEAEWANVLRTRYIGDFEEWQQSDRYEESFRRLLRDLRKTTS